MKMKCKNARRGFTQRCFSKGFTLIELLVVVLIIGILAAVAMPQYQKAAEKSRAQEALTQIRSIIVAIEEYELANGAFPTTWDQLSVVPIGEEIGEDQIDGKYYSFKLWSGAGVLDVMRKNEGTIYPLFAYVSKRFGTDYDGHHLFCYYLNIKGTSQEREKIHSMCKSFGGVDLYLWNDGQTTALALD